MPTWRPVGLGVAFEACFTTKKQVCEFIRHKPLSTLTRGVYLSEWKPSCAVSIENAEYGPNLFYITHDLPKHRKKHTRFGSR